MKRSDIENPHEWTFYEAILDDLHFEWPDPFDHGIDNAMKDCRMYLDNIFEHQYTMRSFKRKGE